MDYLFYKSLNQIIIDKLFSSFREFMDGAHKVDTLSTLVPLAFSFLHVLVRISENQKAKKYIESKSNKAHSEVFYQKIDHKKFLKVKKSKNS